MKKSSLFLFFILIAQVILSGSATSGDIETHSVNTVTTIYEDLNATTTDLWMNITFENETTTSVNVPLDEISVPEHTVYTFNDSWELPGVFIGEYVHLSFAFYFEFEGYTKLCFGDVDVVAWFNGYKFNSALEHAEPYTSPIIMFNTETWVKLNALTRTPTSYIYSGTLKNLFSIQENDITAVKLVMTGNLVESNENAVALEWHKTNTNQTLRKSNENFWYFNAFYKVYVPPGTQDVYVNISLPYIDEGPIYHDDSIFTTLSFEMTAYPYEVGTGISTFPGWNSMRSYGVGHAAYGEIINISTHYNEWGRGAPEPGWYYFIIYSKWNMYNETTNTAFFGADTELTFNITANIICDQNTRELSDLSTVIDYIDYQGSELEFSNTTFKINITKTERTYTTWNNKTYTFFYYNNSNGTSNITYNSADYINGTWEPSEPDTINPAWLETNPTNQNGSIPDSWFLKYQYTIYNRLVTEETKNATSRSKTYQYSYNPSINFTPSVSFSPELAAKAKTGEFQIFINKNSFLHDANVFTNSTNVLKDYNLNVSTLAYPPQYYLAFNSTYIKNTWAAQIVIPTIKGKYSWLCPEGRIGVLSHTDIMLPWDRYDNYRYAIYDPAYSFEIYDSENKRIISSNSAPCRFSDYNLHLIDTQKVNITTSYNLSVWIYNSTNSLYRTDHLNIPPETRSYVVYRADKIENFKLTLKHDVDPKRNNFPSEKLIAQIPIETTPGGLLAEYYIGTEFVEQALVKKQIESRDISYLWRRADFMPVIPVTEWQKWYVAPYTLLSQPYCFSMRLEGMINLSVVSKMWLFADTFFGDILNIYIDNRLVLSSEQQKSTPAPSSSPYQVEFTTDTIALEQELHYFKIEYVKRFYPLYFDPQFYDPLSGFSIDWRYYDTSGGWSAEHLRQSINKTFLHYSEDIYNENGAYNYPEALPGYPYMGYVYNALFLEEKINYSAALYDYKFYYFYHDPSNATSNITFRSTSYGGYWQPELPADISAFLVSDQLENINCTYITNSDNTDGAKPEDWFIMLGRKPAPNITREYNPFVLSFGFYVLFADNTLYPYLVYEYRLCPEDIAKYKVKEEFIKFDVEGASDYELYYPTELLRNPNPKWIGIFTQVFHNYPYSLNYTDILNPEVTCIGLTSTWTPTRAFADLTTNDTWTSDAIEAMRGSAQLLIITPMNTSISINFDKDVYNEGDKINITVQLNAGNSGTAAYNGISAVAHKELEITFPVFKQLSNGDWVFEEMKTETFVTDPDGKVVIDRNDVRAAWGDRPVTVIFDYDGVELKSTSASKTPFIFPSWLVGILYVLLMLLVAFFIILGVRKLAKHAGFGRQYKL